MSHNQKTLDDLRNRRKQLLARLQEIWSLEKALAAEFDAPIPDEQDPLFIQVELHGKPSHYAAEAALRHIGDPASQSDIAKWLIDHGYESKSQRAKLKLTNTLLISMGRKPEIFEQLHDGTWTLCEWES